ncbi:hypothetical protein OXX80_002377 [Metschnikowia pulcherrima]
MVRDVPPQALQPILNTITKSENAPSFTISNPFELSADEIAETLVETVDRFKADMWEQCMTHRQKKTELEIRYETSKGLSELQDRVSLESVMNYPGNENVQGIGAIFNASRSDYTFYAALCCIEQSRIIGDRIYLPKVGDPNFSMTVLARFSTEDNEIDVSPSDLTEAVKTLLLEQQFYSHKDRTKYFTFKREVAVNGNLATVEVIYNDMDSPKRYFQRNFLTPGDKVVKATQLKKIGESNESRAFVVIDLGSDKIPPRVLISDRLKANIQHDLDHFKGEEMMKRLQEDIDFLEKNGEILHTPEAKRLKVQRKSLLNKYRNDKERLQAKLDKLAKISPYKPIPDQYNMRVRIIHISQFCPLCHSTSHSFRDCKERGCKICYDRRHPAYKCRLKCKCNKRGRLHAAEECPNYIEQFGESEFPTIEETRRENKENNDKFHGRIAALIQKHQNNNNAEMQETENAESANTEGHSEEIVSGKEVTQEIQDDNLEETMEDSSSSMVDNEKGSQTQETQNANQTAQMAEETMSEDEETPFLTLDDEEMINLLEEEGYPSQADNQTPKTPSRPVRGKDLSAKGLSKGKTSRLEGLMSSPIRNKRRFESKTSAHRARGSVPKSSNRLAEAMQEPQGDGPATSSEQAQMGVSQGETQINTVGGSSTDQQ